MIHHFGYKHKWYVPLKPFEGLVQVIDGLLNLLLLPTPWGSTLYTTYLKNLLQQQMRKRIIENAEIREQQKRNQVAGGESMKHDASIVIKFEPRREELSYEERIRWFMTHYYETGMEYAILLDTMKNDNLDALKWYDEVIKIPKYKDELDATT